MFESLENSLIKDYHKKTDNSIDLLYKNIIECKKYKDFSKKYNSVAVLTRFVDDYKFEEEWVYQYIINNYIRYYNALVRCKND